MSAGRQSGAVRGYRLAVALVLAGGICLPAGAQLARLGGEFRVNVAAGNQRQPDVAVLANRGFVVVWSNKYGPVFQRAVMGRRFASDGSPLGSEFQVAPPSAGGGLGAKVAGMPDGGFVVVWDEILEQRILARRYGPDGGSMGAAFQVDEVDIADDSARDPDVASAADGSFVVVWHARDVVPGSGNDFVKARRFSAATKARGPEFAVATDISDYNQYDPAVDAGSDGSFVVVWNSDAALGRSFDAHGSVLGPAFLAADTGGISERPAVCVRSDGSFVVAWSGYVHVPEGDSDLAVQYRFFERTGRAITGPLRVSQPTGYTSEDEPVLSCGDGMNFALVWRGGKGLEGRYFPIDSEASDFAVTISPGTRNVALAGLRDRRFALLWDNCRLDDSCNIFGQILTLSGPVDCTGDCNRDGHVTIDEVVRAVRIDLNSYEFPASRCLPADPSLDYEVSVGELLQAVGHALDGCP